MRINHYLKKNRNTESPNNILIVDTEAHIKKKSDKIEEQTFRLGYAIHLLKQEKGWSRRGYPLYSIDDFWGLLDKFNREKTKLYVFAHNMAYDYAILKLDTYISTRHLEITMRVIDSVFIIKAGGILFLSSTNYYRQKLEELGKIFGLSKMESPNFMDCTDSELMPYCKRDTEVLTQIILQHIAFIVQNDLGSFRPTIAGQSMTAFRHRFMSHDLLVHNYPDILTMEKESYRGGRCEVFKMGRFDDITCVDINSMYPFVMKEFPYPTKLISSEISRNVPIEKVADAIKRDSFVLAHCHVDMREPVIAIKGEKLLFPIGKFHCTITSPEIEYILNNPECGEIVSFDEVVFYEKAWIFSAFVDFFYNIRQTAKNEAVKAMAKVLLNSLYGKFGQHNSSIPKLVTDAIRRENIIAVMDECGTFEVFTGDSNKYVRIGNDLYFCEKIDGEFSRDSIPIIASAVTSYARMLLWDLIDTAGRDNVIYCDTDSLFLNAQGLKNLESMISSTDLGKLKIEKVGSCEIRGAKDYIFNGQVKLKGIKHDAEKISDDTFIQSQFHTKNRRYRDGTPDGIVVVEKITKTVSRKYSKGILEPDGRITPFLYLE